MLTEAVIVGVVIYGLVFLLQDAEILEPIRSRLRGESGSFVDRLLRCSFCVGIWAGAFLALGDLGLTLLVELGGEFWATAGKRLVAWTLGGAVVARVLDPVMFRLQAWGAPDDDDEAD